ncbi:hypothetical protein [Janthinobacterium sp. BJB426]|uniref:hypothetical protein n=1 Tax=Janthinobacterium sp. BJB426 TaxID=2048010 RepID=UPI001305407A|nr:hypothetical protein [Janthinobacterium sp. BJB426]
MIDYSAVRAKLRTLSRSNLLVIAERAAELIPADQLSALLGDIVDLGATTLLPVPGLIDDTLQFVDAAMAGHYYAAVEINNRGRQEQSIGTDAFVAEFDRLVRRCALAPEQGQFAATRESVGRLLDLLRYIDEGNDNVLFFTDDGSSLNISVNWHSLLQAYFKCLSAILPPVEFAHIVLSTIDEFVRYDREHHLVAAHVVASDAQRDALRTLALVGYEVEE